MVWLVPHPIRWFRIVAVIALLITHSRSAARLRRRSAAHRLGDGLALHPFRGAVLSRPSGGGPPPGTIPGESSGLPWDRVLILMAVARGHCGSLHRAADDADAGATAAAIAWHAIFELRPYREGAPETSRGAR